MEPATLELAAPQTGYDGTSDRRTLLFGRTLLFEREDEALWNSGIQHCDVVDF